MSFVLPVERVIETEHLLAFYHPRPAYPLHLLLLPKREISALTALTPADQPFLQDLFSAVQQLVERYDLEKNGYRLIANGGPYQEFPRLHFHLVSGEPLSQAGA